MFPKWLIAANLSLLILFPIAWMAPLARLLPFFKLNELTILNAIGSLWEADAILAILVILLKPCPPSTSLENWPWPMSSLSPSTSS